MYKIYKLVYEGNVVYVGKTRQNLRRRLASGYKWNEYLHSIKNDCDMILIEETEDVSRERYWIDFYGLENLENRMRGDGRTLDEEEEWNKEYKKKWAEENREKHLQQMRDWKKKNKDNEEYKRKRKEYNKEYNKEYYKKNREKRLEYAKEYFKKKNQSL